MKPEDLTDEDIREWLRSGGSAVTAKMARRRAIGPGGVGRRNRARKIIADAINARKREGGRR